MKQRAASLKCPLLYFLPINSNIVLLEGFIKHQSLPRELRSFIPSSLLLEQDLVAILTLEFGGSYFRGVPRDV